jgi:hypothetical protein
VCDAIQGDLDAIAFHPIASTIIKLLRFKFVCWRPRTAVVCIVGLLWLHHIQSLGDVTVTTNACNLRKDKNDIKAVMLPWKPDLVFTVGQNWPKGTAGFRYKGIMVIF